MAATLLFAAVFALYFVGAGTPLAWLQLGGYNYVFVILIGRWIYLHATRRTTAWIATAGASFMAVLYGMTVWRYEGSVALFDAHPRIVALGWAVVLFLLLLRFIRSGPWRPVAFIGDISYGLYLFHIPVMWLVLPIVSPGGRWFEAGVAVTVALTIATAWASNRFLETPMRRFARAWLARRGSRHEGRNSSRVVSWACERNGTSSSSATTSPRAQPARVRWGDQTPLLAVAHNGPHVG